jgi:type IV pilus assembly protein PilW
MKRRRPNSITGFSLVELLIGLSVGLVVVGAAVDLFRKGLEATFLISQRAEMQQSVRAAVGLLSRDISLAGAGIPTGGIQLPSGNGSTASFFGCDGTQCYVPNNAYPNNHLFSIIPGAAGGPTTVASGGPSDTITMAYVDTTFPLNLYTVVLNSGTLATATPPAAPPVPPITDPGLGLKVGDLIMFSNNTGFAVGELTGVTPAGALTFANLDPLKINQSGAASGNISAILGGAAPTAYRIWVVTYFVQMTAGLDGVPGTADDIPRLMRQVNAQPPVPVAENIFNLQVTYDTYDDAAGVSSNLKDVMATGQSLNQIRKVNLSVTARSAWGGGKRYQAIDLATSVSARNMSFRDRYQ